ncbi:uracil-DNA glycosylase [Archangium sp.]|uniref:uracil-DNA glycosylase n=1 Tax=Archangium sp. TaxID=1872627 RepID=UPI002ED8C670
MSEALDTSNELSEVLEDLRRHLLWQEEAGGRILQVDARLAAELRAANLRPQALQRAKAAPQQAPAAPSAPPAPVTPPPVAARPLAARPATPAPERLIEAPAQARPAEGSLPGVVEGERPTLDQIRRELGDCRRCKLCDGRKNIVFGSGNPRAELVFVGEGPGETEDLQGVPFVGAAGELLTKMIEAMGYRRDDVYICNVVKCRPPGNRNPEPDEVAACEPFLRAQLRAVQPKAIVALGKFAAQTLLRDSTPITRMRGQWREYEGIKLMPTFHPAYLLRQPAEKKKAWEDLQQVMKFFGKQPGQRG